MPTELEQRVRFDLIRYANCWEDAHVLCAALNPGPGRRMLSIASGGDNSFALAAEGAEVVAADLSFSQLACCELKAVAIRRMDYDDVLAFLGVRPSDQRALRYAQLRPELSERAQAFWDSQPAAIANGFIHVGKFEGYFHTFRTRILPLIHGRRMVDELMTPKDEAARHRFYEERWSNLRWQLMFRAFFSKTVMGHLGRDPEFFRYVQGSVSERILERARYGFTVLPPDRNPYLDYILNGNYTRALPRYLEPERFAAVREGLGRITWFEGPAEKAAEAHAGGGFDGFNLSDIFEYLDEALCAKIYGQLLERARPGARFAYWNMLVPRRCPEAFRSRVRYLEGLSQGLFRRDFAFFYSAFVVEEVMGGGAA